MKMPLNYEERVSITDRTCGMKEPQLFDFSELLDFEERKMLEYGDLFIIDKDGDYWFSIVYMNGKWYAITGDPKLVEISREELAQYKFYNKNLTGSPYQDFLKRDGIEEFNKLSPEDKCYVFNDDYYTRHINETMDGLKGALENLINILENDKKVDK